MGTSSAINMALISIFKYPPSLFYAKIPHLLFNSPQLILQNTAQINPKIHGIYHPVGLPIRLVAALYYITPK